MYIVLHEKISIYLINWKFYEQDGTYQQTSDNIKFKTLNCTRALKVQKFIQIETSLNIFFVSLEWNILE